MHVSFYPIGTIHTPFTRLEGMPIQPSGAREVEGTISLEPEYEAGLRDLDGFSHIILLYHFHQSKGIPVDGEALSGHRRKGPFFHPCPAAAQPHRTVHR